MVSQTSQPPGFARGWSVVPRCSKSAWSFLENDFFLLYTVIRELMDASRFAILCLLKWLYRRVQVAGSQVLHQGAVRVETKGKQRSDLCVLDTACIHQVWLIFITCCFAIRSRLSRRPSLPSTPLERRAHRFRGARLSHGGSGVHGRRSRMLLVWQEGVAGMPTLQENR